MKPIVTAAALAVCCCAVPAVLSAQSHLPQSDAIHTPSTAHVSLTDWLGRVGQELEGRLIFPEFPSDQVPVDGMVQVKFHCSDSGASDKITVFRSSGSSTLDRAAVRAVKRLKQLHPLATGASAKQPYIAMVLFATTTQGQAEQLARISEDARKRNTWFKGASRTASTGIMLAPVGS